MEEGGEISIRRQCSLLGISRSGLYYEPVGWSEENLVLMRLIDELYTKAPFYGSRRMEACLEKEGHEVAFHLLGSLNFGMA